MRNKRKFFTLPIAVVISVLLLGSCGKGEAAPEFDGVIINVVSSFDETDGNYEAYETLVQSFEEQTGATVNNIASKSGEQWKNSVIQNFNEGDLPDVLFFFKNVPEITQKTVSVDVIRQSYPSYAGNISAAVLNEMKADDGNVYAVPVTGFWEGVFINKSLFNYYRVPIPYTYDMLFEAIEKFKEAGIIPIAASLAHEPHYLFELLLYNETGPEGHTKSIPSQEDGSMEQWETALDGFRILYEAGAFQEDINITHVEALELFLEKEAAMFVDGSWRVGSITDKEDVIVIPFPGSDARKTTDMLGGFSMGFHITETAWEKNRDAAVAFVDFMSSEESVALFNRNGAASPVPSVTQDDADELMKSISDMNRQATAFVPAVQDKFDSGARKALFNAVKDIATGEKTAKEAIDIYLDISD